MAGYRFTHPEQGLSRKVSSLSDFDYRVWEQTKLSADDFGVLPFSPLLLRTDNKRLRLATDGEVQAALVALRDGGLLIAFEHQDEAYACAPTWATWQPMSYPRRTIRPRPPADVLAQCDAETQRFFTFHPGGVVVPSSKPKRDKPAPRGRRSKRFSKDSENPLETVSEGSEARVVGTTTKRNTQTRAQSQADQVLEGGQGETPPRREPPRVPGGPPGLIVGPGRYGLEHGDHVDGFCDFVCLPGALFREFAQRVVATTGVSRPLADVQVTEWAKAYRRDFVGIPGDDRWTFWKNAWAATHGSNRPSLSTRGHARGLDRLIEQGGKSHG